jgi:hypothetical protein
MKWSRGGWNPEEKEFSQSVEPHDFLDGTSTRETRGYCTMGSPQYAAMDGYEMSCMCLCGWLVANAYEETLRETNMEE